MAKQKKKRSKIYKGAGAAMTRPSVTRVTAVQRSRSGQWVYDNKRMIRAVGIALGILIVIALIVSGIVGLLR